jgi:hypothetical protein
MGWIPPELHFGVPITRDLCLRLFSHTEELLRPNPGADSEDS